MYNKSKPKAKTKPKVKKAVVTKKTTYTKKAGKLRRSSTLTNLAIGGMKRFVVLHTTGSFFTTAVNRAEAAAKGRQMIKEYNVKAKQKHGVKPLKYKTVHPV